MNSRVVDSALTAPNGTAGTDHVQHIYTRVWGEQQVLQFSNMHCSQVRHADMELAKVLVAGGGRSHGGDELTSGSAD
jgi:hypothetical protein